MVAKQNKIEAVNIAPFSNQKVAKDMRGVAAPFGWLEENRCHDTGSLIATMPKHANKNGNLVDQQTFLYSGRSNAMFILLPFIVADGIAKLLASLNPLGFNFVEFAASGRGVPALSVGAEPARKARPARVGRKFVAKALNAVKNLFSSPHVDYLDLLRRKGYLPAEVVFDGNFLSDLVEGDSSAFYAGIDRQRTANDNIKTGNKGKIVSKAA